MKKILLFTLLCVGCEREKEYVSYPVMDKEIVHKSQALSYMNGWCDGAKAGINGRDQDWDLERFHLQRYKDSVEFTKVWLIK